MDSEFVIISFSKYSLGIAFPSNLDRHKMNTTKMVDTIITTLVTEIYPTEIYPTEISLEM